MQTRIDDTSLLTKCREQNVGGKHIWLSEKAADDGECR